MSAAAAALLLGLWLAQGTSWALPKCTFAAACSPLGYNCGSVGCVGNKTVNCGACASPQSCGGGGSVNVCGCTPSVTTCASGQNCGTIPNGCGGTITCGAGTCSSGNVCTNNVCQPACTPATSCPPGKDCGTMPDGCGGLIVCGTLGGACSGTDICNNGNQCVACTPATACSGGKNCGTEPDGCGGVIACGTLGGACTTGSTCASGICTACVPTTCAAVGKNCGVISDGCGGALTCGSCSLPMTCGGGGTANQCGVGGPADLPTLSFGAGSLVIPMDQCYNPSSSSASVAATDWSGSTCGIASAGDVPACWPHSYTASDIRKPYGLLYLFAVNHIPVYVINKATKVRLTDADITITPPVGSTQNTVAYLDPSSGYVVDSSKISCGVNPVQYAGMPFVVEASYAQQALKVLKDFNSNPCMYVSSNAQTFANVPIHVANYPFDAPVLSIISTRPKPVGISQTNFFDRFFDESGITAVVPFGVSAVRLTQTQAPNAGNGLSSRYSFPWSSTLDPNPVCSGGTCSSLVYTDADNVQQRVVDILWTDDAGLQFWKANGGLQDFFHTGGIALVVGRPQGGGTASGALAWETGTGASMNFLAPKGLGGMSRQGGNYCPAVPSSTGVGISGPPVSYPASDPFIQLGGLLMDPVGGGQSANYSLLGFPASPGTMGLYGDSSFAVLHGRPMVNNVLQPGHLIYQGSSNAWSGGSGRKDSGLHVLYNTLVSLTNGVGTGGTVQQYRSVELTRSSPVGRPTGEVYIGTFDWFIPKKPDALGNILYQPPASTYPYVTGHFREFKPTTTTTTDEVACDPSAVSTGCNWDTGRQLAPWGRRASRVFVGSRGSSGGFTMTPAAALTSDATMTFVGANIGTSLGGVDHAGPAVVEGRPNGFVTIAGAQARPTIAYFGARDGMLHAVCVVPEPGASSCYGSYARGEEIWAFIPAGMKAAMDKARANNDWSKINLGGTMRVLDVQSSFSGDQPLQDTSGNIRTVLIFGTRSTGHIVALDISNPSPNRVNQDGFKLLWENDGTNVAAGVTPFPMGLTDGVTIATSGRDAVAIATSSTGAAASPGIQTYVMRITDGKILATDQKLYRRKAAMAGGVLVPIPNDVPPMAVALDVDSSGDDETLLVADIEGVIRSFKLNASTRAFERTYSLFDTSSRLCTNGVACQPLGVSPSVGRRGANNSLTAFVATGGVDWARQVDAQSYIFGFDIPPVTTSSTVSPYLSGRLGTILPPAPPGAPVVHYPLRSYAPLTIAGTDVYAAVTSLAVDTNNQLVLPSMYPGTYGAVESWGGLGGATVSSTATVLVGQGRNFGASAGSILQTNSSSTDGSLTILGTNQVQRITLATNSTSLRSSLRAVNQPTQSGDSASSTLWWCDLSN